VSVLGNVDAGKSTLLGVLTHGEHDNGRGRARLNLFRHLHEIQSGRTSCISHEILGFDGKGNVIPGVSFLFHQLSGSGVVGGAKMFDFRQKRYFVWKTPLKVQNDYML